MKPLDEYEIPFYGLKEGMYEYDFDVKSEFFEYFNHPDFRNGKLKAKVLLHRKPQLLELSFIIHGSIKLICDRCLDEFMNPVDTDGKLYVRFGNNFEELDDNIIVIPIEEKRINIAQYIYEFIVLSLPVKRIHPVKENGKSDCNPEMLRKIAEYSSKNIEKIDPRWDNLKKIMSTN